MFTVTKPPINIGNDLTHYATSRQIASDPSFEDEVILIDDEKNEIDLLSITIDLPLTINDKYYMRDKLFFKDSDGAKKETDWSRPIMITKNMDGFNINDVIIGTPVISLDFDKDNAPIGGFTINSSDYSIFKGNGIHKYTDWYIQDLYDNVIWKSENDTYNLTSISIPECILNRNRIYIIKARYKITKNKFSNFGKTTICTNSDYFNGECPDITNGTLLKAAVATLIDTTL